MWMGGATSGRDRNPMVGTQSNQTVKTQLAELLRHWLKKGFPPREGLESLSKINYFYFTKYVQSIEHLNPIQGGPFGRF